MKSDCDAAYRLESPLGEIEVRLKDGYLTRLQFADRVTLPQAPKAVSDLLAAWFSGHAAGLEMLSTRLSGTAFQNEVWQALRAIPRGCRISYRELAVRLGRPSAVRAVASAVAANPVLLLIPCHRVIGSDGKLHGYAGGVERKRALLVLESAPLGSVT